MPTPFGSRCQEPSFGGAGKPKSEALTSVPSAFRPVAIMRGTSMKWPETDCALPGTKSSYFWNDGLSDTNAQTASASSAMYAYTCDCDGLFVKVSSPVKSTTPENPGTATVFSWFRRPRPQIGRFSPDLTSCATTTPACLASGAPIVAGHALPVRLTQSTASSFVKSSARSKPCSVQARKLEQKRWKFSSLETACLVVRTPALCWFNASMLTSAFVKSFCEFASVGAVGLYGNGTSDVSWL